MRLLVDADERMDEKEFDRDRVSARAVLIRRTYRAMRNGISDRRPSSNQTDTRRRINERQMMKTRMDMEREKIGERHGNTTSHRWERGGPMQYLIRISESANP